MHNRVMDAGGGGLLIETRADELTDIYQQLIGIMAELEKNAVPNILKLTEVKFYTAGKAMDTMEAFPKANARIQDLYDHYTRASTLVTEILQTMIETDEALAERIITKLGG